MHPEQVRRVSIHAPAWGATSGHGLLRHLQRVSIHAPAWGATSDRDKLAKVTGVSIHAPAWGATYETSIRLSVSSGFNPRARVGRDDGYHREMHSTYGFNPRARVGRDKIDTKLIIKSNSFNPRARVGRDPVGIKQTVRDKSFNPRARVGRDGRPCQPCHRGNRFQSTRPRGARHPLGQNVIIDDVVSIHAPAWGATRIKGIVPEGDWVSIHAPAWGATKCSQTGVARSASFNPRARVGRDPEHGHAPRHGYGFNPRARVGRDRRGRWPPSISESVSIHAPAWGATPGRFSRCR